MVDHYNGYSTQDVCWKSTLTVKTSNCQYNTCSLLNKTLKEINIGHRP